MSCTIKYNGRDFTTQTFDRVIDSLITDIKTKNVSTNPKDYIGNSGGAIGSDTIFDQQGRKFGLTNTRHYVGFGENASNKWVNTNSNVVQLSKESLDFAYSGYVNLLGKERTNEIFSKIKNEYTRNLILRNFFQVYNSQATYAIGHIIGNKVEGGTGYAVELNIAMDKPTFVLNIKDNQWYVYDKKINSFRKTSSTPKLVQNYAAIGTRNIDINWYLSNKKDTKSVQRFLTVDKLIHSNIENIDDSQVMEFFESLYPELIKLENDLTILEYENLENYNKKIETIQKEILDVLFLKGNEKTFLKNRRQLLSNIKEYGKVFLSGKKIENNQDTLNENSKKTINIYSTEKNGFESLSNFAERPFIITEELADRINKVVGGDAIFPGEKFKSVEHAFQFLKIGHSVLDETYGFDDNKYEKIIEDFNKLDPKKPSSLKGFGKKLNFSKEGLELWDKNSYELMKILIKESLNQNEKHKNLLIRTKDSILTHNQDKSKWNKLFPKALMEIREEFIQEKLESERKYGKQLELFNEDEYVEIDNKVLNETSESANIEVLEKHPLINNEMFFYDGVGLNYQTVENIKKSIDDLYKNTFENFFKDSYPNLVIEKKNYTKDNLSVARLKNRFISENPNGIIALEVSEEDIKNLDFNNYLNKYLDLGIVINPFISGTNKQKVNNFKNWLLTGNNNGNTYATERLRQNIFRQLFKRKQQGKSPILSETVNNHSLVLNEFLNTIDFNIDGLIEISQKSENPILFVMDLETGKTVVSETFKYRFDNSEVIIDETNEDVSKALEILKSGAEEISKRKEEGQKSISVSTLVNGAIVKPNSNMYHSVILGNKVDEIVRNFFTGKILTFEEQSLFNNEKIYEEFLNKLLTLRELFHSRGEKVLSDEFRLANSLETYEGQDYFLNGITDIVTIDNNGVLKVYDIKSTTLKGLSNYDVKFRNEDSLREKHNKQISSYALMLANKGLKVSKMGGIIRIPLDYNIPSNMQVSSDETLVKNGIDVNKYKQSFKANNSFFDGQIIDMENKTNVSNVINGKRFSISLEGDNTFISRTKKKVEPQKPDVNIENQSSVQDFFSFNERNDGSKIISISEDKVFNIKPERFDEVFEYVYKITQGNVFELKGDLNNKLSSTIYSYLTEFYGEENVKVHPKNNNLYLKVDDVFYKALEPFKEDGREIFNSTLESFLSEDTNSDITNTSASKYVKNNVNTNPPLTDVKSEIINYKKTILFEINKAIKKTHKDLLNPLEDKKKLSEQLKYLIVERGNISKQLSDIIDSHEGIYKILQYDMETMLNALDNIEQLDIKNFKDRLSFLHEIIYGKELESSNKTKLKNLVDNTINGYDILAGKFSLLLNKYNTKLNEIRDKIIENEITYIKNVKNGVLTDEQKESLFTRKKDLNIIEKYTLGVGQSSNNDTILPQIAKNMFDTEVHIEHNEAFKRQEKLKELAEKVDGGFNWVFERKKSGALTGHIIGVYSVKYRQAYAEFFTENYNIKDLDKKQKHKMNWYHQNTEVIDFTKLKVFKDEFGQNNKEYYVHSDNEMALYENELRQKLGPLYESEIEKLRQKLQNFELLKNSFFVGNISNDVANREFIRMSPYFMLDSFLNRDSDAIPYELSDGSYDEVHLDFNTISFIPKRQKLVSVKKGSKVYSDTGFYNETFEKEVLSNKERLDYWLYLKELYEDIINPTYEIGGLSYAKFDKEITELISEQNNLLGKSKVLMKETLSLLKQNFYEKGLHSPNNSNIVDNYSDVSKIEINKFRKSIEHKSDAELAQMASKLGLDISDMERYEIIYDIASETVLKHYSMDINVSTGALLEQTALQRARMNSESSIDILLESYKAVDPTAKNGIEKFENWRDVVVRNYIERDRGTESILGKNLSDSEIVQKTLTALGNIPALKKLIGNNLKGGKKGYLYNENETKILENLIDKKNQKHPKNKDGVIKVNEETLYKAYYNKKKDKMFYSVVDLVTGAEVSITEQQYEDAYQSVIDDEINNLGLDLNVHGVIQGILKTIILKSMAFNPYSGITNRIEGKGSNHTVDETGEYWTVGNVHYASNFMMFANLVKMKSSLLNSIDKKRVVELKKFETLVNSINIIQDRTNVLDRQVNQSTFDLRKYSTLPFAWSITNPEYHIQGETALCVLMDKKILNKRTGQYDYIFDKKTMSLQVYDLIDGKLRLKDDYRTQENIRNWENFDVDKNNLEENDFMVTKLQMQNAISRVQGNYEKTDTILLSKKIWGMVISLFRRWMPEHGMQRFSKGDGFNLTTGRSKAKGRYIHTISNTGTLVSAGAIASTLSFGLTPLGMIGTLGIGGYVAYQMLMNRYNNPQQKMDNLKNIKAGIGFLISYLENTIKYPFALVNQSHRGFLQKRFDGLDKLGLSQEELGGIRATAKELAIKTAWLAIGNTICMSLLALADGDDDEKEKWMRRYNFMSNQIDKITNSISFWHNPTTVYDEVTKLAGINYLKQAQKAVESLIKLEEPTTIIHNFSKITPLPSILTKGTMPLEDERKFSRSNWISDLAENIATGGESGAKKDLKELRKEYKKQLEEKGYSEKRINKELRKYEKKKGMTYKELRDKIEGVVD